MSWEGLSHTQLPAPSWEDEYQLQRSIGNGSFGQVYLVLHKEEQREYVMKSIELQTASDEGRQQMELEVQLLKSMQHPNIVAYRESFVDDSGHLCIFMEYCEHGDIFSYLQDLRRTQMPSEAQLLEWFTQIVWALQALHQQKILHRDLKTQNIFLAGSRQQLAAKLGDFGVAKVLSSTVDLAKTQIGTPFYMSPELINSHPYSYKSDVWGLGCVLYEIINGHRAFDAQSLNGLALKIIKGSYTPISAGCSNSTKQLIQQMLTKNPSHRPSLKEILHMPQIRSKILPAYRSSIAAGSLESRPAIESALNKQLASLGLGGLVNAPAAKRKNPQRLQARLERAKDLQQREEQVLQQTIALLQQCLRDPSVAADDLTLRESQPMPPPPPPPPGHGRQAQLSPREEKLSPRGMRKERLPPAPAPPWAPNGESLRFEEASQPSKPRQRREHRSTSTGSEAARGKRGRSRAQTEDISIENKLPEADISAVSWMLEYEHVQPENLAHPFQQCRQSVVHSSNSRHRPQPPPLPYGEPSPPNEGPPGASARSWRTADGPFRARTLQHSLKLEALPAPPRRPDMDEDSLSGSSLSFVEELDNKEKVRDANGEPWQRTSLLKERIDDSKAALQKYRMTIDMLQYSFEQPEDVLATHRSEHEARGPPHPLSEEVGWPPTRPPAPAVVQDCSARLYKRCVEGLGPDILMSARRIVSDSVDAEELPSSLRQRMLQMLGSERIGFLSLIDQLVHMERCWGLQDLG